MHIQQSCPHCQAVYKIPEGIGRRSVRCRRCQADFIVNETAAATPRDGGASRSTPLASKRSKRVWPILVGVGGAAALLLAVGLAGAAWLWLGSKTASAPDGVGGLSSVADPGRPAPAGSSTGPTTPTRATSAERPLTPVQHAEPVAADDPALPAASLRADAPALVLDAGGHSARVSRVAFMPDGRHVVSVSFDKSVRVWDVRSGETVRVFRLPQGPGMEGLLYGLAVAPDGKTLATAGATVGQGKHGTLIYLVSLETGRLIKVLKGHDNVIVDLAFSRDGRLASSSQDRTVRIYNVATGAVDAVLEGHAKGLRQAVFSPDGGRVATLGIDEGEARLWSVAAAKTEVLLPAGGRRGRSIAWSPDGQSIAVGNMDGTIHMYNPDGKLRTTIEGLRGEMWSVTFTPDNRELLATGSYAGPGAEREKIASLIDVASGKQRLRFPLHNNVVGAGCISPDGRLAATVGGERTEIHIWRTADGAPVAELAGNGSSVWAVGWSADGKAIAWGHPNIGPGHANGNPLERTFHLDDLESAGPADARFGRGRLSDGTRTLTLDDQQRLQVKDGNRVVTTFCPERDGVYCFTWLPGNRVVVGTGFGLFLIDPDSGKILRTFVGALAETTTIAPSPDGRRFVTGSMDQTVRIWDVERPTPLLSLFFAGQEWIAWTEEGLYAASAAGEGLMGWLVGHGPEALGTYYPAAQFRKSLYRPEVVRQVVAAGSVAQALARLKGAAEAKRVADVLPPAVAITSPTGLGTARVSGQKFEVQAVARSTGPHAVTGMRLLVDGRPHQGAAGVRPVAQPRVGAVRASWSLDLAPGTYSLAVLAESAVSRSLSAPVEVTVGSGTSKPALYVLAVGINAYPGGMRLNFAAPDADAIAQVLRQRSGPTFRQVEIRLLKDEQATKQGIEDGLTWLGSKMTAQDVGLFFFSGHGHRAPDGQFYLVPVNAGADLTGSCVSGERLKSVLGGMPGRLIAALDACHSGAAGDRFSRRPAGLADDLVRDLVSEEYGIVVLSSSLGREYSLESAEVKQGFFTLALTEGLVGRADRNGDGVVYLGELDAYSARRVRVLSGGQQNPVMARPPTVRSFALSAADAAAPRLPGVVTAPDSEAAAIRAFKAGHALLEQGRPRDALPLFEEALRHNPRMLEAYQNRGNIRNQAGQHALALQDAETALMLNPDFAPAWELRALVHLAQERYPDAIREGSEYIRLRPADAGGYSNRGLYFLKVDEPERAMKDLDEAVRLNPNLAAAFENRGLCRLRLSDSDGAVADFNRLVQLKPDYAKGYGQRARAYAAKGNKAEAVKDLEQCAKLDAQWGRYFQERVYPTGQTKPTGNIEEDHKAAVEVYNSGVQLMTQKKYPEAIPLFENATKLSPRFILPWHNLGFCHQQLRNYAEAVKAASEALKLDRDFYVAYGVRAHSHYELRKYDEAIQDRTEMIRLKPDSADQYYNRGLGYFMKKDLPKAIEDMSAAVKFNPSYVNAYDYRSKAYLEQKKYDEAIKDLAELIRLDPKSVYYPYRRGKVYWEKKDFQSALRDFDEAIKLAPNEPDPYVDRANCKLQLGQYASAVEDSTKALALNPNLVFPHGQLGLAYARLGKHAEAMKELDLCAKLDAALGKTWEMSAYPGGRPKK